MSKSSLIKLILFLLFAVPSFASAKAMNVTFEDQNWTVVPTEGTAVEYFAVRNDLDLVRLARIAILGTSDISKQKTFGNETAKIINEITDEVNQPAKDAKLIIDGKFAKEFEPGQNGQAVDIYTLRKLLASDQESINLPVLVSTPSKKLSDTNNLGINELIAIGESNFTGSPKNRIHNITVGANKYNGLIIDQGEEFSFNKYLGDVDGENGFLPELVIKSTGLIPEFGGGLCQVSSTAFRAAMEAGMPITARRNHSFAVQYYAPQGTDATIYPGSQDLKFLNDFQSPVLIRTRIEGTKLFFEYYGTKDNRTVVIDDPIQYDKKADGSMKATWRRVVTMNSQPKEQVFNSTYRPPALFQRVEQSSTPNPEAPATPPASAPAPTPAPETTPLPPTT